MLKSFKIFIIAIFQAIFQALSEKKNDKNDDKKNDEVKPDDKEKHGTESNLDFLNDKYGKHGRGMGVDSAKRRVATKKDDDISR